MNNYHIYEKLGRGKHSTVYKGRKKKSIQYYAIKSVDKDQKARVMQEVRTMHALDHKNVLKFYAWYETTNHLWLILEYCVGGDLLSLLRQDVKLPEASVHDFARDLVIALQYLHSHSIVYCDIKPSNTLLDENGRLKLGGFGLSRRLSDINKTPYQALPQAKRGTPCYMAPELFSDDATHSTSSDLWALGCVLYECAMGRAPFMNSSLTQLMQDILHKEPPPVPGSSPEFADLMVRLLDKNPATRINWAELVTHPFWQVALPVVAMPPEPMLEAFIAKYNLAPKPEEQHTVAGAMSAHDRAKSLRQSVDITRLSKIALINLEKEGDGNDYTAAEAQAGGDIRIATADAELDFEELNDDEEPPSPASAASDDGAMIDQGDSARMGVVGAMDARSAAQAGAANRRGGGGDASGAAERNGANAGPSDGSASGSGGSIGSASSVGAPGSGGATPAASTLRPRTDFAQNRAALLGGVGGGGAAAVAAAGGASSSAGGAGGSSGGGAAQMPSTAAVDDPSAAAHQLLAGLDGPAQLEALMWHPSDTAVKPIVANRRIERLPEPKYDAKALPFPALSLQDLLRADHKDLEAFLTHIYRAIASAAPLKDKVNVLSYFETLCTDNNAANSLINSSLTILFIRMMRNARAPTLRIRLASVMGLLVRHATYIAEELAQTGVIEILTEALKDKTERVRRRVMATLGELLFYIATTQQDVPDGGTVQEAADIWQINSGTVSAVGRLLKPQEDDVAQHYAVKTIENISSQGGDWASRFCTEDIVFSLVQIYNSTKNENLKATAASTISRLLRHSPALVGFVVDKVGVRLFLGGLTDSSSKVQTAAVNMLNLAISQPDLSMRAKAALSEERSLVPSLMALLDHTLPVLRAKGVVAVLLLCRLSTRWLLETCKAKLIPAVERLSKERDEYTQLAVSALRTEMATKLVPQICGQISEELARPGSRKGVPRSGGASLGGAARDPLLQFPVVLHLLVSQYFRSAVVTHQLIADLASYLSATAVGVGASPSSSASSTAGIVEFKATLMHVLEAICQQQELVSQHHQAMLGSLLPAVCEVVASGGESGDNRFFCLRMVSEVTMMFLMDPDVYPTSGTGTIAPDPPPGSAAASVDALLRTKIFPTIPRLLRDEDPMPLYALKLLGGLLEVNPAYVRDVEGMGLAPQFFDFLSLEHTNNNVHNIRLCRQVIANGGMPVSSLLDMQVAEKVAAVLEYATQNNVEPFLEPVLELSHTIVQRDVQELEAGGQQGGSLTVLFMDQAATFLELCAHADGSVSRAAAACVLDLITVFPQQVAPWLLSAESVAVVVNVLQGEHLGPGAPVPAQLQQLMLEALAQAIEEPGAVGGVSSELAQLYDTSRALAASGDAAVRPAATQLAGQLAQYIAQ